MMLGSYVTLPLSQGHTLCSSWILASFAISQTHKKSCVAPSKLSTSRPWGPMMRWWSLPHCTFNQSMMGVSASVHVWHCSPASCTCGQTGSVQTVIDHRIKGWYISPLLCSPLKESSVSVRENGFSVWNQTDWGKHDSALYNRMNLCTDSYLTFILAPKHPCGSLSSLKYRLKPVISVSCVF